MILILPSFYAAHPDVIAVAACTSQDDHAPYSNRGREVSICAPSNGISANHSSNVPGGIKVWQTFPAIKTGMTVVLAGNITSILVASSSTPLVAGICA